MENIDIAIGAVSLVALLSVWTSLKTKSPRFPLPPGPPQIPFLGNALHIDITEPHVTYTQWGHQYGSSSLVNTFTVSTEACPSPLRHVGDIIYSRLLGQDYIIVNSEKVARALSDTRRSAVYADRPKFAIYKL